MFVLMVIYAGMTLWITFSNEIQFDRMSEAISMLSDFSQLNLDDFYNIL